MTSSPTDGLAEGGDPPGELEARHLILHGRPRVEAHALEQVRTVQGTGDHVDKHLIGPGLRSRDLADRQHLRTAVRLDDHRAHGEIMPQSGTGTGVRNVRPCRPLRWRT
jgi:hypothetical protein